MKRFFAFDGFEDGYQAGACFEYQLLASIDSNGFSLNLGTDGAGGASALIGIVVYI
jgi:hypothetical protein